MNELKVGDVVKLNSGSPEMTISKYPVSKQNKEDWGKTYYDDFDVVECTWFNKTKIESAIFNIDMIEKI